MSLGYLKRCVLSAQKEGKSRQETSKSQYRTEALWDAVLFPKGRKIARVRIKKRGYCDMSKPEASKGTHELSRYFMAELCQLLLQTLGEKPGEQHGSLSPLNANRGDRPCLEGKGKDKLGLGPVCRMSGRHDVCSDKKAASQNEKEHFPEMRVSCRIVAHRKIPQWAN